MKIVLNRLNQAMSVVLRGGQVLRLKAYGRSDPIPNEEFVPESYKNVANKRILIQDVPDVPGTAPAEDSPKPAAFNRAGRRAGR